MVPAAVSSYGQQAIDLAELVNFDPMEWQQAGLIASMGITADDRWAAQIVKWLVARQNGKGGALELRQIWGLMSGRRAIHTAHEFKTANKHFERLCGLLENGHISVRRRIKKILRGNNEKSIEMKDGSRIDVIARSKNSGRGLSADDLYLDEDMILAPDTLAALMFVVAASENPQVIMAGTVPQEVNEASLYVFDLRDRSLSDDPGGLVWIEWSADQVDRPTEGQLNDPGFDTVPAGICDDWQQIAKANPSLGLLISPDYIAGERAAMSEHLFRTERMSIWPLRPKVVATEAFPDDEWESCETNPDTVELVGRPVFAVDVSPMGDQATIAVAGWARCEHGNEIHMVGEIVESRAGTGWIVDRLTELRRHNPIAVVIDTRSPAAELLVDLVNAEIAYETVNAVEVAGSAGLLRRLVHDQAFHHLGDPILDDAIKSAQPRPLAGGFAWGRQPGGGDITPLVALSNAVGRARRLETEPNQEGAPNLW